MPSGTITDEAALRLGAIADWSVDADATPHSPGDDSAAVGEVQITAAPRSADPLFVQGDVLEFSATNIGSVRGNVRSASQNDPTTISVTSSDAFYRYVAERNIPAVGSGSPVAAIDMCQQIINGRRVSYNGAVKSTNIFWSLAGHDVGFDQDGNMVQGYDNGEIILNDYSSAQDGSSMDAARAYGVKSSFVGTGYAEGGPAGDYETFSNGVDWYTGGQAGGLYCTSGVGSSWAMGDTNSNMMLRYNLWLPTDDSEHRFAFREGGYTPRRNFLNNDLHEFLVTRTSLKYTKYSVTGAVLDTRTNVFGVLPTAAIDASNELWVTVSLINEPSVWPGPDPTWYSTIVMGIDDGNLNTSVSSQGTTTIPRGTRPLPTEPYTMRGGMFRNLLVVVNGGYASNVVASVKMKSEMQVIPPTTQYDYSALPDSGLTGVPIAGLRGTLWDYIKQVAGGLGVEFHADRGNVIRLVPVGSNVQPLPNYVSGIQRTVSDDDAAIYVELTNYNTDLYENDFIVYDARLTGDTWSVGVNEVVTSIINIAHFPRITEDPMPVSLTKNQSQRT